MPNERRYNTWLETPELERLTGEAVTAYIGLGSNLGDRESSLSEAMRRLADPPLLTILRTSSIYETAPWGYTEQPDFLNCVLEIETYLSPAWLLGRAKEVEQEIGRQPPSRRYGPRLIDVDILLYGDMAVQLNDPDLQIPHPRMEQRAFVLIPLSELNENLVHPTLHVTIASLARVVEDREGVKIFWKPLPPSDS